MAKKTQDLKPDIVLKNYWSDNEQFADIFNAVLFDGRQVIKPEELENVDTEESSVLVHKDYAESIKASRDNIKVSKKSTVFGVELVMLGMESQEHIHYAMPIRVMGYDMIMALIKSSMTAMLKSIRHQRGWRKMNTCQG